MPEVAVASPPGDELGSSAFVSEQPDTPRFARQRVRDIYDEVRRRATKKTTHVARRRSRGSVFVTKRRVKVKERTEVFRYKKTSMLAIIVA